MQVLERPIYFPKKMEFSSRIKPTNATLFIEVLKQPLQVQTTNTTKSSTYKTKPLNHKSRSLHVYFSISITNSYKKLDSYNFIY
jgi:hypothetical protein